MLPSIEKFDLFMISELHVGTQKQNFSALILAQYNINLPTQLQGRGGLVYEINIYYEIVKYLPFLSRCGVSSNIFCSCGFSFSLFLIFIF